MFRNNPNYHKLRYRTLVGQAVPVSMFVHDHNGDFIEVNRQVCENGEIELLISVETVSGNRIDLRFTVRDADIGTPNEQQALFSPFTQADSRIARRFGGTGLGLAVSQKPVNLKAGKLQLYSVVDKGSRPWFVLPLPCNLKAERIPIPVNLTDIDLLVLDDHRNARESLLAISQNFGWRAEAADSGQSAIIRAIGRINHQDPYDVLLIDSENAQPRWPGSGSSTTKLMPGNHSKSNWMPIILMATAHDELRSYPDIAAVDKLLPKPVSPSALVAEAAQRREPQDFAPSAPKKLIPGVRVLIVGDSEINCEVTRFLLEAEGCIVNEAHNGQEPLQWLSAHADEVDIILMDVQVPQMDGYEATKQIKQNPKLAHLPVIAVTAELLTELQAALGINNSAIAEPLLSALEIDLGADPITSIHAQILNFNFRKAEALTHVLLNDIDRLNHV